MCSGVHCPQCFMSVLHCRRFKSSLRTPNSRYNTAFLPVLGTWCSTITTHCLHHHYHLLTEWYSGVVPSLGLPCGVCSTVSLLYRYRVV